MERHRVDIRIGKPVLHGPNHAPPRSRPPPALRPPGHAVRAAATGRFGTARRSAVLAPLPLDCRGPPAILAPGRGQTFRPTPSPPPARLDGCMGVGAWKSKRAFRIHEAAEAKSRPVPGARSIEPGGAARRVGRNVDRGPEPGWREGRGSRAGAEPGWRSDERFRHDPSRRPARRRSTRKSASRRVGYNGGRCTRSLIF